MEVSQPGGGLSAGWRSLSRVAVSQPGGGLSRVEVSQPGGGLSRVAVSAGWRSQPGGGLSAGWRSQPGGGLFLSSLPDPMTLSTEVKEQLLVKDLGELLDCGAQRLIRANASLQTLLFMTLRFLLTPQRSTVESLLCCFCRPGAQQPDLPRRPAATGCVRWHRSTTTWHRL